MFVSGCKWQSGIKDDPPLLLLSCESSVAVKKTLTEKKMFLARYPSQQPHIISVISNPLPNALLTTKLK